MKDTIEAKYRNPFHQMERNRLWKKLEEKIQGEK